MSWLSSFFKGPDTKAMTAAINAQAAATKEASDRALQMQKDAMIAATTAAMPVQDSESARVAGEDRMRKLLAANGGVNAGNATLGTPPVGYRMLTGQ